MTFDDGPNPDKDESGKNISEDIVFKGEVDTTYTTSKKTTKDYTLKKSKVMLQVNLQIKRSP